MLKASVIAISVVLSAPVLAGQCGNTGGFGCTDSQLTSQSGSQSQSGSLAGAGAASVLNFAPQSVTNMAPVKLERGVPALSVPGPTGGGVNPCIVSAGASGVMSGFGFGVSRAWTDKECQVLQERVMMDGRINAQTREGQAFYHALECQSEILAAAWDRTAALTHNPAVACNPQSIGRPWMSTPVSNVPVISVSQTVNAPVSRARPVKKAVPHKRSYPEAVSECRAKADRAYGQCMAEARSLLGD